MVGGRSGKLRNVPSDFLRRFRTDFGRYLVGISDAEAGADQAISCILAEISRCIEIPRKCARKPKIESCEKPSGEGHFLRRFRTDFGRYLVGIGDAEAGADQTISCILAEISRCIEIPRKCARKPKIESCEEWSGGGQKSFATSIRTSYEVSGRISGDISYASAMPKPT